jgi:TRAP-type C4-dicarboxylate transport system permease small subunit
VFTSTARSKTREARYTARRVGNSRYVDWLARAGFAARGVMYALIGILAIEIAFGNGGPKADQSGAVRVIGNTPFGAALLWLLVIGFIGMALWRLSEALYGGPGADGRKASNRLIAGFKAVLYGFIAFFIMKYALGLGSPKSSNKQSVDLTSTAMREPGGRILVGIVGLVLIGVGAWLAWRAFEKKFVEEIKTGEISPQTRKVVTFLGRFGGIARGIVFGAAGLFLLIAAVTANAHEAKGIDATLRAFTKTPAGPWLLVLVAIGLILFGTYSWAESRWRRL